MNTNHGRTFDGSRGHRKRNKVSHLGRRGYRGKKGRTLLHKEEQQRFTFPKRGNPEHQFEKGKLTFKPD